MNTRSLSICCIGALASIGVNAQSILFDFENAQAGSGLPLDLTVAGITAHFTSSGIGGYFIQTPQNTILVTPVGFSGNCLVPSSVYGADLQVDFSQSLTNCSILYAPQELACDSSARMRITAYRNGAAVGTTTTTADPPGTWPSATLTIGSAQNFNRIVVHYDAPPPTGGDYGVIFVADNLTIWPAPIPPTLQISAATNQIQLAWPASAVGFILESNADLRNAQGWKPVTNAPAPSGNQWVIQVPASDSMNFYRLSGP